MMTSQTAPPRLTRKFDDAMAYAAKMHRNQTRKGGDIPYLVHLLTVAGFVVDADGTETRAIAALLHDVAETRAATRL
jgi:(p)ppGpp synthase/HD superfamily hydrolase